MRTSSPAAAHADSADLDTTSRLPISQREFIALLSMVMAMAALGIDMMLPAFSDMRQAFGLSEDSNEVARVVTAYFLGMALAPLPYGALADRFGRRPVLWLSGAIYVVGAIGAALAPTLGTLLLARFVWGVGAAGGRVIAFAIIRDLYEGERMAQLMSYVMAVFILIPIVAPSVGALLIAAGPWRGVFWAAAVIGVLVTLWSRRLNETLRPEARRPLSFGAVGSTAVRMVTTASTLAALVASIALMAVISTYLASSELMVSEVFDREAQFPIVFGAVAIVLGVAAFLNGRLMGSLGLRRLLIGAGVLYVASAVASLVVALASDGRPEFWVFMPLLSATLFAQMVLMPNLNTLALAPMAGAAGTASALMATSTTALGALLGALVDARMGEQLTALPVATTVAGLVIAVMLVPILGSVPARSGS